MDRDEFYDRRNRELSDFETQLLEEFPEIRSAMESTDPPVVRLDCPRGHMLRHVTIDMDPNWHPFLAPASDDLERGRRVVFVAEPGAHDDESEADATYRLKVRLKCPRCAYDGNHTQTTMLKLYAVAVRYDLPSIHPPS